MDYLSVINLKLLALNLLADICSHTKIIRTRRDGYQVKFGILIKIFTDEENKINYSYKYLKI